MERQDSSRSRTTRRSVTFQRALAHSVIGGLRQGGQQIGDQGAAGGAQQGPHRDSADVVGIAPAVTMNILGR